MFVSSSLLSEDIYEDEEVKPDGRRKSRKSRKKGTHSETPWAKSLEERQKLEDPYSKEAEPVRGHMG